MAQKTKKELKNQSSALLETEGTFNTDLIDSLVTMDDVPKEYEYIINSHSEINNIDYELYVHRFGNLVHIEGMVSTESEVSPGFSIKKGYLNSPARIGDGYIFVDDEGWAEHSMHVTLLSYFPGTWRIMNDTDKDIKADSNLWVNITYVTTDPFPDDSELVNPNPIPDKE